MTRGSTSVRPFSPLGGPKKGRRDDDWLPSSTATSGVEARPHVRDDRDVKGGGAYVIAVLATFSIALATAVTVNAVGNPYAVFGTPVIRGVNDVQPQRLGSFPRRGTFSYLLGHARRKDAPVVLVGTSHVATGIPTCAEPGVVRVAESALSLEESDAVMESLVGPSGQARTVLLEVTQGSAELDEHFSEPHGVTEALLSFDATRRSLASLYASLRLADRAGPRKPGCMRFPAEDRMVPDTTVLERRAATLVPPLTPDIMLRLRETIETFQTYCHEDRRHHLRLFVFPVSPWIERHPRVRGTLRTNVELLTGLVGEFQSPEWACEVSFVDLTEALPNMRMLDDMWYDDSHFTPVLGQQLLAELLAF